MTLRVVFLFILALVFACPVFAETLTADTSRPNMSTFAFGERVQLTFQAAGLTPSSSTSLNVVIKDAHDNIVVSTTLPVNATADGSWSGTYSAPSDKLGFYRVFPTLADGTTLAKFFTRQAGYLTYAIVPDPANRVDYGEAGSIFGMQGGFNDTVNIIPYLGVRWVLGGFNWSHLETDHAGELAEQVAKARQAGQIYPPISTADQDLTYNGKPWNTYLLICMNGVPNWASDPASRANQAPLLPSSEKAYQDFCSTLATDYATSYPQSKLHMYQVTWEPVYPWGYKGTNAQLVRIYQLAYPALHKADSNAIVIGPTGGGISDTDLTWAESLFKAGLGQYLDGFAIHPYFPVPPERAGLVEKIQRLKDMIRRYTGKDLPIYGTEQGFATKEDPSKELLQAQGLVREYLIMAGEGLKFNFSFYAVDYVGEPGYGFYYNLDTGVSWGANKIGPKPVVPAYAAMTYMLDGHRSTQRIDWLGPDTLGYAFQRRNDVVLALWNYGDTPREVTVPVGVNHVTVYDWMGNARVIPTLGGSLTVTLTGDPIYVKGASSAVWGANTAKPLAAAAHHLNTFPGLPVTVTAHLLAANGPLDGVVSLAVDRRLEIGSLTKPVKIPAGVKVDVKFGLQIPSDAEIGDYPATLTLKSRNGQTIMGDGVLIDVAPPITIAAVTPIARGGKSSLELQLRNAEAIPLTGEIHTRLEGLPGGRQAAAFSVADAGSKTIELPALDADISPDRVYNAVIDCKLQKGSDVTQSFHVDFLQAPKLRSILVIDGSQSAWSEIRGAVLAGRDAVTRRPDLWTGNNDLSATVKYAWDDHALYLFVDATDDVFYQEKTGFDTWNGDCVQLGIDIDNGKAILNTGNELEDQKSQHRWSEFTLALTKNGPEVYRTGSYNTDLFKVAQVPLSAIALTVVRTGNHTIYETAIPWRMLGKDDRPWTGERLGVALSVNDIDSASQLEPKAVGLFGGMNGHKDMNDYGVLTLGAGN